MKKLLQLLSFSVFLVSILLFASCNGSDTAPSKTDTLSTPAKTDLKGGQNLTDLSGYLDSLFIDSSTFFKLARLTPPRLTLRFYDTLNNVTLHGWSGNSNSWNNKPPNVRLAKGRQSTIAQFGSGSYFGNLQLSRQEMFRIRDSLIRTKSEYVVFGPVNPAAGSDGGQISYNIFVTNDDPRSPADGSVYINKFALTPANVVANPSPPRNSN